MFKLQGWVEEGNTVVSTGGLDSTNVFQGSFPGATVTVYIHGSNPPTLATIYSDDNPIPTPLANPFVANADGTWGFYATSGRYDVVFSGANLPGSFMITDLTNGAGGGTGDVAGPGSAIDGDIALFDGTSGKIIKDGQKLGSRLVTNVDSGGSGFIPVYNNATGTEIKASGILANNVVQSPLGVTQGNIAIFRSRTVIIDSGVSAASLGNGFSQASKSKFTGGSFSTGSTSFVDITGITKTMVTGAHRCILTFSITASLTFASPSTAFIDLLIDGVSQGGTSGIVNSTITTSGGATNLSFSFVTDVLTAASHTFKLQAKTNAGATLVVNADTANPLIFSILETLLST